MGNGRRGLSGGLFSNLNTATPPKKQELHAHDAANAAAAAGPSDPNDLRTNIVRSGAMAGLALMREGDKGEHVAYHYLRGRIGAWRVLIGPLTVLPH